MPLPHTIKEWKWIWIGLSVVFLGSIFGLEFLWHPALESFRSLAIWLFLISWILLIGAGIYQTRGHHMLTHPTSFMGQIRVKGEKNTSAMVMYFSFSVATGYFTAGLGKIFSAYYYFMKHTEWLAAVLYFSAFVIIMHGYITYDITRIGHLIVTMHIFATQLTANIFFLVFFFEMESMFPWSNQIPAWIQIGLSLIYMIGYFTKILPALFQKFWIAGILVSLCYHMIFFSSIL